MKALSVRQPWAWLIMSGRKTIELRPRGTSYRGPLLICASKRMDPGGAAFGRGAIVEAPPGLPRGVAVCVCDLVDVRPAVDADVERSISIPAGRLAWVLGSRRLVEQVPVSGRLGLFDVPDDIIRPLR